MNRLKRWTLAMTLTSNRSLRVFVTSSGFSPLFVSPDQLLTLLISIEDGRGGCKGNPQNSDGVIGIEERHDTRVADEVVDAPTGDVGGVGGSLLLNAFSACPHLGSPR